MKIAHIINPVKVPEDRDLSWQQPITFETMRRAKVLSSAIELELDIELVATLYPEDKGYGIEDFIKTEPLEMSVLDVQSFRIPRKLPLFKEILQKLYDTSDADYFI